MGSLVSVSVDTARHETVTRVTLWQTRGGSPLRFGLDGPARSLPALITR